MQHRRVLIKLILGFSVVLAAYVLLFSWVEHRRAVKGPWLVTFSGRGEYPRLIINHPTLNIRDVTIEFRDVRAPSNIWEEVSFSQPRNPPYPVPFGECIFQDLLFLPGNVTLKLFGHQVQLLPRMLTVDQQERPWHSGQIVMLHSERSPGLKP